MVNNVDFSGKRNTAIQGLDVDVTAIANQQTRDAAQNMKCYIMLARYLRYRRTISPAMGQRFVFCVFCVFVFFVGTSASQFSNELKTERFFPGYRQRVALYSAYRQHVGDISSVAAAKLSVSARHTKKV